MIIVTSDDVASGWRPLTDAEIYAAPGLIDEALVTLGVSVPGLDGKDENVVKLVVKKMVRRVLKNPEGLRVREMGIDDYREGGTVDSSLSTGEIYVSAGELALLGVRASGKAFEVGLSGS